MDIKINFAKPPRRGKTTTLLRCHFDDKQDINAAAKVVGISAQEFMRVVLLQATRAVLANKGEFNGKG